MNKGPTASGCSSVKEPPSFGLLATSPDVATGSFKMTPGTFKRTPGSFQGPRGPFKGLRGPFKGPRGPFKGPRNYHLYSRDNVFEAPDRCCTKSQRFFKRLRGPFKGPRGPCKGPRGPLKGYQVVPHSTLRGKPWGPFKGPRGPFKGVVHGLTFSPTR